MSFFLKLGLEPDGDSRIVEGHWLEEVFGIDAPRVEVVMLKAPGDRTSLQPSKFHHPLQRQEPPAAPADELGLRHIAFE
jgi:hypothetical protein